MRRWTGSSRFRAGRDRRIHGRGKQEARRTIGLVPELKHSTYFRSIDLPLEDRFLATFKKHAYSRRAPIEVQSFEIDNLRYLRSMSGRPGTDWRQVVVSKKSVNAA